MKPHYIDHSKRQTGKLWDSRRDARDSNCVLKGQGKKKFRPKGGEKVGDLPILEEIGGLTFLCLYWNM